MQEDRLYLFFLFKVFVPVYSMTRLLQPLCAGLPRLYSLFGY